jgi:hypothetical protein
MERVVVNRYLDFTNWLTRGWVERGNVHLVSLVVFVVPLYIVLAIIVWLA